MTLLCTPPGQDQPYDGMAQLTGFVVDEMYRWRDDSSASSEPRPYLPNVDMDIDNAIAKHNLHTPPECLWWDVVDLLFDAGDTHHAGLAQRYAVPTLTDAVTAARRPQIRSLMDETQIGSSSENVIHAFERMISSSIRELPILAGATKFDIGDTRICALDLMDVSPQGDDTADRQTAIMYMLARHVLVRNWWINEEAVKYMPEKYRIHHEQRLRIIKESPKRLCYDEFHRTSRSKAVRAQIVRDVREGRKWGVQIVLSSQLLKDFDNDMVDLATGVWILGSAISDSAVQDARDRFSLSDTAVWIMRNRLTGPRAGGAPALLVLGTNEGRYEQHLINTLGPIELWALSTSAEDVMLRKRLYTRLGAGRARQALAANFPGGSARSEIKRRIDTYTDQGDNQRATTRAVVEEIAEELVHMMTQMAFARMAVDDLEDVRNTQQEKRENRVEAQDLGTAASTT
jgi:intracellular multiplication protein IcmB